MGIVTETSYFGNFKQEDDPKALIIPVPYEGTSSLCKGTKNGPQAILNASTHLGNFDDELWTEINKLGINTSNFVNCEFATSKSKEPFLEVEEAVRNSVIGGSLPVVVGGEHSISFGILKAIYDLYPDVSVLYFDSRPNVEDIHKNNKYSSFSTLRRICEAMPDLKITLVGARSFSQEEVKWLEKTTANIEIFFAKDKNEWKLPEMISNLSKNVYISFDFSALDSSIMPSCSLPEPGGLSWDQTTDILKNVCAFKEIVGIDFVEFSSIEGVKAPDLLAAKLVYKTIGYAFARNLGVFEEEKLSPVKMGL